MLKKKVVLSDEYRDLEQSYMQLNHYLKKFHQIRAKVSQQISERAQCSKKNREPDTILDNLFPQGVAGVNREAERDLKKIVNMFKQLEARLQQLNTQSTVDNTQSTVEIPSAKTKKR
ncbi:type III secretion system chaperone SseA [Salmonella enterica subsp. arizonae serovar 35:z4,z32:-]|nr:type III secretion system chaperone SseA [Salmonella enterica subsp. arizonae serovar 35:z4,z32:-]